MLHGMLVILTKKKNHRNRTSKWRNDWCLFHGKGFKTTYRFNEKHLVGAFYTSSNGLFNDNNSIISYGSWYRMKYDENIRLNAAIGRNSNNFVNRKSTIISVQPSVRFLDIHNLSLLGGYNRSKFENNGNEISNNGFLVGANYGTSLLKKKLISYFNFRFNDRNFSNGTNERMFFNQRLSYEYLQRLGKVYF